MTDNCLKGKSAIITGGRRGIGKAIALAFARAGADIAVCDNVLDDGLLVKTKEEAESLGSKARALQTSHKKRLWSE
jgi:3-oxoacyl-[acyl-carrier protein] reductase